MSNIVQLGNMLYEFELDYYSVEVGGARGVMVIVVGYGHDDTSSNPGPG